MSQNPDFIKPMVVPAKPGPQKASGTSGKAIASLILGLISILGMCFTAIPGLVFGILGLGDIGKSAGRLGGKGLAIGGIVLSTLGILWTIIVLMIGIMLPAVQQVREAARRAASNNCIKQQVLAMHNYHSAYNKLPLQDNNGLSWRVHILPFIEEQELYSRFNLDEPWDSPNNIQLLPEMPTVYDCLGLENVPPGFTVYQVPYSDTQTSPAVEDYALFDNSGNPISFRDVADGLSKTIMIMEVDPSAAVQWTKPADWEFSPSDPSRSLGNVRPGVVLVGFADGSSIPLPNNLAPETMKALFTRSGGEIVSY